MTNKRIFSTLLPGPALHLGVGALLAGLGPACAQAPGFPVWAWVALGCLSLLSLPGSLRLLVLGEDGFHVRSWRIRVEMDYGELETIEVVRRRLGLLSPRVVEHVALRSRDDRITWIAGPSFAFSRRALAALAARLARAGLPPPALNTQGAEGPPARRSPLLAAAGGALLLAGLALGFFAGLEGRARAEALAGGRPAEARLVALSGNPFDRIRQAELELQGVRRREPVTGGWAQGREAGAPVSVRVHPRDGTLFVPAGPGASAWSALLPGSIALALAFAGGRLLARSLAVPVGAGRMAAEALSSPAPRPDAAPGS